MSTKTPDQLAFGDRVLLPLHADGMPSPTPLVWRVVGRDGEHLTIARNGRRLAGWRPRRLVEVPE